VVGVIYLAAIFAIVAYVFDLPIQGLLATSGAIAIIIGLALQSSLSDVFSGLVLSFSRPYLPDDFIRLEGGTEGKVVEMNWRATHILTSLKDLAIIPNSVIAKSKIVNVSSASHIHGVTAAVRLEATTRPSVGIEILDSAMLSSRSIVAEPPPTVIIKSISGDCIEYELTFFVLDLSSASEVKNELFDLVFRQLSAAGIHLASSQAPPPASTSEGTVGLPMPRAERLLELATIFETLTSEERAALAKKLKPSFHDDGELLLKPGVPVQSLYIVGRGVVSVTRVEGAADVEILRLGPGDHFGTISLLTGTPNAEKVTTIARAIIYELPKADLRALMAARPQVAEEVSHALALRQAEVRTSGSVDLEVPGSTRDLSIWLSERIRKLFNLGGA
jgi:CRP-like cAMP-binding protein